MDNLLIRRRMSVPVTTGIPEAAGSQKQKAVSSQNVPSFRQVLEQTAQAEGISFTKHAAERVVTREIQLTASSMERLNEGLKIAQEKGMEDALILMDGSAFIVNAKSGRVITALDNRETNGKAITNISGAVII